MKTNNQILLLLGLFAVLMSVPFLVPHTGAVALVGLVPLLCAERLAYIFSKKHFFWWYAAAFLVWNLLTTWWVCKATVGGGIFASVFNALQMSLIFGLFRISRKKIRGVLPYIFLAVAWIAWERWYMVSAEISWPWIVLGNAFGRTTHLVQWYDTTGLLGGSLWIWAVNLSIFGLMVAVSNASFFSWNNKAKYTAAVAFTLLVAGPIIVSEIKYDKYEEKSDCGTMNVCMAQSNFDPWHKLRAVPQREQNAQVVGLFKTALEQYDNQPLLLMLPETFTSDIWLGNLPDSPTWQTFSELLSNYNNASMLFGATTRKAYFQRSRPGILSRQMNGGWYETYNSALLFNNTGDVQLCHKNKLVIGSEKTPYPKIFVPFDDMLGGLMGRSCIQGYSSVLNFDNGGQTVPLGVPICYESIYSEYCTEYVRKGAKALCVITNDGWWGNTPGYHQHFSYSRLRAIETRRDIARCANTGISAFIDQRGDVLQETKFWTPDFLQGSVNLTDNRTFFVRYGDIVGRVCTFVFLALLLALIARLLAARVQK